MAEFDFQFEQKPSKANQAADALSQKSEHVALCMLAHLQASKLSGMKRESIEEHTDKNHGVLNGPIVKKIQKNVKKIQKNM